MKIIKHGEQLYGFTCSLCGCVWRAGKSEVDEDECMTCPDCGNREFGKIMYPNYKVNNHLIPKERT